MTAVATTAKGTSKRGRKGTTNTKRTRKTYPKPTIHSKWEALKMVRLFLFNPLDFPYRKTINCESAAYNDIFAQAVKSINVLKVKYGNSIKLDYNESTDVLTIKYQKRSLKLKPVIEV